MTSVFDETICVTCGRSFILKVMDRLQDKDNFCNIISNRMRLADDIHPVRTLFTCFSHNSGTVLFSASDPTEASPQIASMSLLPPHFLSCRRPRYRRSMPMCQEF